MYKFVITSLIIFIGFGSMEAQRYRNPGQYLRQFNNQKRKADIKGLLYLEASLKGADARRTQKYQEIVLEQLQESKRDIERLPPYEDDDLLKREYVAAFDMLIKAYDKGFRKAEDLRDSMYESYDHLKHYYEVVTAAEDEMYEASYKIEAAEDHFIKSYYLDFERDEEIIQRYIMLDEATLHSRDMTLAFFRVEAQVQKMLNHIEADELDSIEGDISEIRKALELSANEVEEYSDFEGEDDLLEEMTDYIEEMKEEVNFNLIPLAEKLQNRFLGEKEYENTQKELQRFIDRQEDRVEDFYEARADFIEEYIPED